MMLLAAVVLILAFLALSAMVSRVSQLASVTSQEQDRPILLEVGTLRDAVDELLTELQAATPDLNATSSPTLDTAIEAGLRHLVSLEAARGLSLSFGSANGVYDGALACPATGARVWFRLSDGELTVELPSTQTYSC